MTDITTYPNCSYAPDMRIEADPDIGGIGVSDALNTLSGHGGG